MRTKTIFSCAALLLTGLSGVLGCSSDSDHKPSAGQGGAGQGGAAGDFGPLGDRKDLPVDERLTIENLSAPVDVVRDKDGRPHLYASSVADAMRAEGFIMARDRFLQLELLRRTAEGRVAEVFGDLLATTIDQDIAYRQVGLGRVAKAEYDAMTDGENRQVLDAFADGVTQVFRQIRKGAIALPKSSVAIPPAIFTDWSGPDTLAIAKLQTFLLSYDTNAPVQIRKLLDAARAALTPMSSDALLAKRAGFERDFLRFAPADPAATTSGYPGAQTSGGSGAFHARGGTGTTPAAMRSLAPLTAAAEGYQRAIQQGREMIAPEGFGSNGWIVSPSRSATGHVLLANDPHLTLSSPSTFWPVSIEVHVPSDPGADLKVSGMAFPGVPGIMLGHNEHIAWGATVAQYMVTDLYAEQLTPDGKAVMFKGGSVPMTTIDEVIEIHGQAPYTYHVKVVPHHGPILPTIKDHQVADPDPAAGALSVRWTGHQTTHNFDAAIELLRARSVDEARTALNRFTVGAQNWVIGDTAGNILWTSHANIPLRDPRAFTWNAATYQGTLPCLISPGDGTAEWTGFVPGDLVPWAKNPASGYLATANNDPIGDAADNDPGNGKLPDGTPVFLSCLFDIGFRAGRIEHLIESHKTPFSPEEFSAMQADVRSPLGARLAPRIIEALDRAAEERTTRGAHPDLTAIVADPAYDPARMATVRALLKAWGDEADYAAASGMDLDTNKPLSDQGTDASAVQARASEATLIFNVWLVRMIERTFGDELARLGITGSFQTTRMKSLLYLFSTDPTKLATFDPATQESAIWDDLNTPAVESRNERVIRAVLDALAWIDKGVGSDVTKGRWGAIHTLRFDAIIPLLSGLSIPPPGDPVFPKGFPRGGDLYVIDLGDYGSIHTITDDPTFTYSLGPAQRFVVSLDPAGPKAWNALPGGNVWDAASPHFRDEAELWRKNKTHPVPFLLPDVIAAKESRTVAVP